jgi:hypothetical protein
MRRFWGGAALFCWLVALFMVILPVKDGSHVCGRPFTVALSSGPCGERAAGRVQGLAFWLLLTAPITLGYYARKAAAGPERPE